MSEIIAHDPVPGLRGARPSRPDRADPARRRAARGRDHSTARWPPPSAWDCAFGSPASLLWADRPSGGGLGRKARRAVRRRRAPAPRAIPRISACKAVAMLNLAEYRKKPKMLADFLPWAALVAPGVVLNKDGSFQRTARFRGPDLDSATAGRARRHHRAAQQRAASARLRLGDLRRGKPHCGTALSAEPVSRSGLGPRRRRAPSAVRGSGSAFREPRIT